ncbi:4-hydroxy-3-methylbut-2-enyl diphosphate reductase [Sesbania bispinosa]|nr:4-hydroxy-3-methylbut-2-enyl diphosphate reductase [Sesbania bispinosa]
MDVGIETTKKKKLNVPKRGTIAVVDGLMRMNLKAANDKRHGGSHFSTLLNNSLEEEIMHDMGMTTIQPVQSQPKMDIMMLNNGEPAQIVQNPKENNMEYVYMIIEVHPITVEPPRVERKIKRAITPRPNISFEIKKKSIPKCGPTQ